MLSLAKKKKKSPRDVIVLKVFPTNPMGGDELCREFTQPFNLGKILQKSSELKILQVTLINPFLQAKF